MSSYYWVPFASVSSISSFTVWYATWSTTSPNVSWSTTPPSPAPNGIDSWVACVTTQNNPPTDAVALGDGTKDLPPPSSSFSPTMSGEGAFREAFVQWLDSRSPM
jgi:hypothetical protein